MFLKEIIDKTPTIIEIKTIVKTQKWKTSNEPNITQKKKKL